MNEFASLIIPGGRVFELDSAHGRDARFLRNKGLKVFCTDIIPSENGGISIK